MKKLQIITGALLMLFTLQSNAQVSVSLNIGSRPDWCGHYYEDRVQYVYLPELECYYDNYAGVYIYYGPSGWLRSRYLPEYCHGYDINRARRVVIDYRGSSPWSHFDYHRNHYWRDNYRNYRQEYYGPNYNRRGNHVAVVERRDYRDNRDYRGYKEQRDHRDYDNNRYAQKRGNGNGNAHGHYKRDNDDRGRGEGQGRGNGHGRR